MGFKHEISEITRYRNAYLLALSASMGSIFYGWDMFVSLFLRVGPDII